MVSVWHPEIPCFCYRSFLLFSTMADDTINSSSTNNIMAIPQIHQLTLLLIPMVNITYILEKHTGFVLVSPPLNGDSYYHWRRAMKHVLSSKNKLKFIDGKITQSKSFDPLFDSWECCNNIVVSRITRALSPQISHSSSSLDCARVLFTIDSQREITFVNHICFKNSTQCAKVIEP